MLTTLPRKPSCTIAWPGDGLGVRLLPIRPHRVRRTVLVAARRNKTGVCSETRSKGAADGSAGFTGRSPVGRRSLLGRLARLGGTGSELDVAVGHDTATREESRIGGAPKSSRTARQPGQRPIKRKSKAGAGHQPPGDVPLRGSVRRAIPCLSGVFEAWPRCRIRGRTLVA